MTSSFYRPPVKDITITSSIGRKSSSLYYGQTTPHPSTDFESFPIEAISSSTAGVFPDLHGNISSSNYVINITQSWSSSILGPLGYGVFINDDQKEFYNGELSGSNLTISDQRLIDEDCIPFLEVSTTGTPYSTRFYYSAVGPASYLPNINSASLTIEDFLHDEVAPTSGQIYLYYNYNGPFSVSLLPAGYGGNIPYFKTIYGPLGQAYTQTGVAYIKINRTDLSGSDNTLSLQSLQNLRIRYSDVPSPAQYDVVSISEFPNYYLYLVAPVNITSSLNDDIDGYSVVASKRTAGTANGDAVTYVTNYNTALGTGSTNFNTTTGKYTFPDTPNIGMSFTASVVVTGSAWGLYVYMLDSNGNAVDTKYSTVSGTSLRTIAVSGTLGNSYQYPSSSMDNSVYPITGYQLVAGVENGSINPRTFASASFTMSQFVQPNASNPSTTIISPFLSKAFTNTDCDTLMNNAVESRVSSVYSVVDFNNSTTVPNNIFPLILNSADSAQVNDYNFYSTPRQLSKYKGAKLRSKKLNVFSSIPIFGSAISIPEDDGPDKTPNFQLLDSYFIYFDWIASTSKELYGNSYVHIKALIDIDGNIYEPSEVDANGEGMYWNSFVRTFFEQNKVKVLYRAGAGSYPTPGLYPIKKVLQYPEVIISSQIEGYQQTEDPYKILQHLAFSNQNNKNYSDLLQYYDETFVPSYNSKYTASNYQPVGYITASSRVKVGTSESVGKAYDPYSGQEMDVVYTETIYGTGVKFNTKPITIYVSGSEYASNTSLSGSAGQSDFGKYVKIDQKYKYSKVNLTLNFQPIIYNTDPVVSKNINTPDTKNFLKDTILNTTWYVNCWKIKTKIGGVGAGTTSSIRIPTPYDQSSGQYLNISLTLQNWIPSSSSPLVDVGGYLSASYINKNISTEMFNVDDTNDKYYFELKFRSAQFRKKNNSGIIDFTPDYYFFPASADYKNADIVSQVSNTYAISYDTSSTFPGTLGSISGSSNYGFLFGGMGLNIFNPTITVGQTPAASIDSRPTASYSPGTSLYYWTTGSDSKNILTGSQFRDYIYKLNNDALYQALNPSGSTGTIYFDKNSDYPEFKKFSIYPDDEIRFENDENQVFKVVEVFPPGGTIDGIEVNNILKVKLDRDIPDGTNIDAFMIRRYSPLVNSIIVDGDATQGYNPAANSMADGFIVPEFFSPRVDYNMIIQKLYEKGIIPIQ